MADVREMRIFSAEQIVVPEDLPEILKDYSKEVIRNNPNDIIKFRKEYFTRKAAEQKVRAGKPAGHWDRVNNKYNRKLYGYLSFQAKTNDSKQQALFLHYSISLAGIALGFNSSQLKADEIWSWPSCKKSV